MKEISFRRGLSNIPKEVASALSPFVINELSINGHGISFPEKSGCQMRCIINGNDYGGFYSYNSCNGIQNAIGMAMSRYKQLQVYRKELDWKNLKHTSYTVRMDKRKGKVEHRYSVGFMRNGKPATKSFFIGYEDQVTPDKVFHAYRTAMIFKWYVHHFGEGSTTSIFKNWRTVRIYDGFSSYDDWH